MTQNATPAPAPAPLPEGAFLHPDVHPYAIYHLGEATGNRFSNFKCAEMFVLMRGGVQMGWTVERPVRVGERIMP